MKKILSAIGLVACICLLFCRCSVQHNESYYKTHPEALAKVMQLCAENSKERKDCARLKKTAQHVNRLMDELRENPQLFGQSIVSLQSALAQPIDKSQQVQLKQALAERMAIVRWLETPGGAT
jgi:hypothetical protein